MKDMLIAVPYRDREQHLAEYLENTPAYFDKSNITYDILICELAQGGDWNAGICVNSIIDFLQDKKYKWLYVHHVDVWPIEGEWEFPGDKEIYRHLGDIGSCLLTIDDFLSIGGYCNTYWGWGGEDCDIYANAIRAGFKLTNRNDSNSSVQYYTEHQNHPRPWMPINRANTSMLLSTKYRKSDKSYIDDFFNVAKVKNRIRLDHNIYRHTIHPLRESPAKHKNTSLFLTHIEDCSLQAEVPEIENPKKLLKPFTTSVPLYSIYSYDMHTFISDVNPDSEVYNDISAFGGTSQHYGSRDSFSISQKYIKYKEYLQQHSEYDNILYLKYNNTLIQEDPFQLTDPNYINVMRNDDFISADLISCNRENFLLICNYMVKHSDGSKTEDDILTMLYNDISTPDGLFTHIPEHLYIDLCQEDKTYNIERNRRIVDLERNIYSIVNNYNHDANFLQAVNSHYRGGGGFNSLAHKI